MIDGLAGLTFSVIWTSLTFLTSPKECLTDDWTLVFVDIDKHLY